MSYHDNADLDSAQDHRRIVVLELRHDSLANMLALLGILRLVRGQRVEQGDPAPLTALVERDEKLGQGGRVDDE